MQAHGNLCDFQIIEKRKEMGGEGLEKSQDTGEVGGQPPVQAQELHRQGSEHQDRNALAHTI